MANYYVSKPTHRAYSLVWQEGQGDHCLEVGSVYPHKDGHGFNLILYALPIDEKIVCREIAKTSRRPGADPEIAKP